MSRVARWRRVPDEPTTARGWLFRNDLKTIRFDRREVIRFWAIALVYAGIAGVVCHFHPHAIGIMAPIAVGATNFVFERTRPRKKALPKDPPEIGDAFEVLLTVRDAHGLRTGGDRGWIIFSQGWVLFEGARTNFAVTRGESSRQIREGTLALSLEDGRKVTFTPVGEPSVTRQLNRAFNAWEVAPIPEGEAVLPPRETHPEIWAERHALCVIGLLVSLAMIGSGAVFHLFFSGFIGLFTGVSCVWVGSLYARRLRDGLSGVRLASSALREGRSALGLSEP